MRKVLIAAILAALVWGCGGDNSTNNNGGISLSILPYRGIVDYGDTTQFYATVVGTTDDAVIWKANNAIGGDSIYGFIDNDGIYIAPLVGPDNTDSIRVTAILVIDTTKTASAWAILIDPSKIYVSIFGSDSTGLGSERHPYRTITKALDRAMSGQTIYVGAGDFNIAAGEDFPLLITTGITVHGSGPDSTFITGPGGVIGDPTPWTRAAFEVRGDAITIERLLVRSSNLLGVGFWLKPGIQTKLVRNVITNQNIGVYASGAATPRPILDGNRIISDSIGIVTADSSRPILRNNYIYDYKKYGIEIRDFSWPDLGMDDSTNAGHDTLQQSNSNSLYWLIYNGTPNTIWAIGNVWPNPIPEDNDIYIYDDEEPNSTSGEVILSNRR